LTLNILVVIAWRNLWRNRRRTLLTVGTVAVGLGLLLVFLGIGDGGHQNMIANATQMGGADVAVQARGYQLKKGIELTLPQTMTATVSGILADDPAVEAVLPRVFASGLASSADGSSGVTITGIDPAAERSTSLLDNKLIAGDFFEKGAPNGAVIGQGVARKLKLAPGEKFVIMAQGAHSTEIESILVRVVGIMQTGLDDIDQVAIFVRLPTAQQLLRLHGRVHQIAVMLSDPADADDVARRLKARLPAGTETLTWDELMPGLRDFIRIDDAGSYLFNAIFFLIIAFMVLNTLLMSVLERRREFALLDAMGLTPARRFLLVTLEAIWIAALASVAGLVLGYSGHLYLHIKGLPLDLFYSTEVTAGGAVIDPIIYSDLSFSRIAGATAMVFALTLLLALIPAWRGARGADAHLLGQT
jgi:ABC-type lipoprotein release transport system permease subunit